jgi:hypothetical protein
MINSEHNSALLTNFYEKEIPDENYSDSKRTGSNRTILTG